MIAYAENVDKNIFNLEGYQEDQWLEFKLTNKALTI